MTPRRTLTPSRSPRIVFFRPKVAPSKWTRESISLAMGVGAYFSIVFRPRHMLTKIRHRSCPGINCRAKCQ